MIGSLDVMKHAQRHFGFCLPEISYAVGRMVAEFSIAAIVQNRMQTS